MNINGAVKGCPGLTSCVGKFRDSKSEYVDSFSAFVRVQTSIYAEFIGVIYALEHANMTTYYAYYNPLDIR